MEINIVNICDVVKNHLKKYPEDSSLLLDAISQGLKDYKTAVENYRNRQAQEAVHNCFVYINKKQKFKTKTEKEFFVLFLIEAMFIRYRDSSVEWETNSGREMFFYWLSLVKELNYVEEHKDFIIKTRGVEIYNWLNLVLEKNK